MLVHVPSCSGISFPVKGKAAHRPAVSRVACHGSPLVGAQFVFPEIRKSCCRSKPGAYASLAAGGEPNRIHFPLSWIRSDRGPGVCGRIVGIHITQEIIGTSNFVTSQSHKGFSCTYKTAVHTVARNARKIIS